MSFDAYYQWLGIPPREQPPNHYRLLGLELFESNEDVISNAADRQMVHLRSFQTSKHASHSQRLLNEVSAARICLLDPKKRAAYDEQLRKTLPAGTLNDAAPPPPVPPPPPPPPISASSSTNAAGPAEQGERPVSALLVSAPPGKPMVVSVAEQTQDVAVTGGSVGLRTGAASTRPRIRRRKSAAGELLKIVAGGVVGSCAGIAILWYGFGIDLLGLRESLPKEWLQVAGIPPAGEDPHSPTTSPQPPHESESGGEATGKHASSTNEAGKAKQPEPKTKKSNEGNQGDSPPSGDDEDRNQSPTPSRAPSIASSKPNRPRVPPPSASEQAKALQVLEAVHRPDTARSRSAKRDLAEKLIQAAEDPTANDIERFVILKKAAELSEEAGIARVVMQVVERMEQAYEIDGTSAREKLLIRTAPNVADESSLDDFVQASQMVVTELVRLDRLDEALRLTDATYDACLKPHGKKQRKYVYDGRNSLRRLHQRWVEANAARRAIESGDNDATNYSTLGQFLCVYHEDWDAGLEYLTRAPEAALRAAAEADLAKPNTAADRVLAGDLWYDVAKSNAAFDGFAARAIHWYELAEPQVTGLVRTKTTMRLEEMRTKLRDFDSREMSIGGLSRRKP